MTERHSTFSDIEVAQFRALAIRNLTQQLADLWETASDDLLEAATKGHLGGAFHPEMQSAVLALSPAALDLYTSVFAVDKQEELIDVLPDVERFTSAVAIVRSLDAEKSFPATMNTVTAVLVHAYELEQVIRKRDENEAFALTN